MKTAIKRIFAKNSYKTPTKIILATLALGLLVYSQANAQIQATDINHYASVMKQSANNRDLNKIADMIADDVIIKITRNGKSATLNKIEYLKRLQQNWQSANNYSYNIQVSDIISSGDHIKANITTQEVIGNNTYVTQSRATLTENNNKAVLLKAVSQVSVK
ncbi:MAG: hypothetical protein KGV51_05115 [Moraxellaceae bacterium]|nr:hypothetical protein [Moraxellaceae bacterium]